MQRLILYLLLCLAFSNAAGQQIIQRVYSNIGFTKIVPVSDGGFLICGINSPTPWQANPILIKIDSVGNQQWVLDYKDTLSLSFVTDLISLGNDEFAMVISVATNYIGGYYYYSMRIIKIDSAGNVLIQKKYDSSFAFYLNKIIKVENNNLILAGLKMNPTTSGSDFLLVKLDPNMNILWAKQIEYKYRSNFMTGCLLSDGNYSFQGRVYDIISTPSRTDIVVAKTDTAGNILWFKQSGNYQQGAGPGSANVFKYGDLIERNGEIFNAFNPYWFSSSQEPDVVIQKIDLNGNEIAAHQYGNDWRGGEIVKSIAMDSNNNLVFTTGLFLIKTDNALNLKWVKRSQSTQQQSGYYNSILDAGGGYLGISNYSLNSLLIKSDTSGNIGCNNFTAGPFFDQPVSVGMVDVSSLIMVIPITITDSLIPFTPQSIPFYTDTIQCLTATSFSDLPDTKPEIYLQSSIAANELILHSEMEGNSLSTVCIYSIEGKLLSEIHLNLNKINYLNVDNLNRGTYILSVKINNYNRIFKFIKL